MNVIYCVLITDLFFSYIHLELSFKATPAIHSSIMFESCIVSKMEIEGEIKDSEMLTKRKSGKNMCDLVDWVKLKVNVKVLLFLFSQTKDNHLSLPFIHGNYA